MGKVDVMLRIYDGFTLNDLELMVQQAKSLGIPGSRRAFNKSDSNVADGFHFYHDVDPSTPQDKV